jgi:phage/plasmid-like protein (TIGR03299 family)
MPHEFESGIFYRQPAWHRLGKVMQEWPGSWEAARAAAGLEWDVEVIPLAVPYYGGDLVIPGPKYAHLNGYQLLKRSDKELTRESSIGDIEANPEAVLGVQPSSYHVILNRQFGEVIEYVLGEVGEDWAYETLISLSGGRSIVAVLRARQPLSIGPDPSKTFNYIAFMSRHDGQGGLKGIPTNLRVACANMRKAAENQAKRDGVGFTIRHTSSWKEQIEKAGQVIQAAVKDGNAWATLATKLGGVKLVPAQRDRTLKNLFPISDAMTDKQVKGAEESRDAVRGILESKTCEGIERSWLGMVNAVDEWCDHVRPARSDETRTSRSLLRSEPMKAKVLAMARVHMS